MDTLATLSDEDSDMVLRAVRVGVEGNRKINYRHVVSHEFPLPYEVNCNHLFSLIDNIGTLPGPGDNIGLF